MKRIFQSVLFTGMITLFSMSSCKKETYPTVHNNGSPTRPAFVGELLADNWTLDTNGFYTQTFRNITYPGALVKVFLVSSGKEEEINQYTIFMGGQLWANAHDTDLTLYYRCNGPIPFSSLAIRVVVE